VATPQWASLSPSVATVDVGGLVHALVPGVVTIVRRTPARRQRAADGHRRGGSAPVATIVQPVGVQHSTVLFDYSLSDPPVTSRRWSSSTPPTRAHMASASDPARRRRLTGLATRQPARPRFLLAVLRGQRGQAGHRQHGAVQDHPGPMQRPGRRWGRRPLAWTTISMRPSPWRLMSHTRRARNERKAGNLRDLIADAMPEVIGRNRHNEWRQHPSVAPVQLRPTIGGLRRIGGGAPYDVVPWATSIPSCHSRTAT